jgi:EamA-like transporter family.
MKNGGKNMRNKVIGALFLSLAASIWGAMYVVVKVVVDVVPPLELVWIRYVIAVITLAIIGICMKQSWKIAKRDWLLIFLVGLIGNTISIVTQETGTMLSTAQMGAIITATTPAFMVIFARFILKEK